MEILKRWTENEINVLKENYNKMNRSELYALLPNRTDTAINTKLNKLNLSHLEWWSEEEDILLKQLYPVEPIDDILQYFPNRTKESLRNRAKKFNLHGCVCKPWTDDEIKFLRENWELLSDNEIAVIFHRTKNAIKRKRNLMGLHRQDKNCIRYESIVKYVRGNSYQWKLDSIKNCNYQCIFTGSRDFVIHHLFPVSKVLREVLINNSLEYKPFEDYSKIEREYILDLYLKEQEKYPLGICLKKDIHELFHSLYSRNKFTIDDWNEFVTDYKNGKYDS